MQKAYNIQTEALQWLENERVSPGSYREACDHSEIDYPVREKVREINASVDKNTLIDQAIQSGRIKTYTQYKADRTPNQGVGPHGGWKPAVGI